MIAVWPTAAPGFLRQATSDLRTSTGALPTAEATSSASVWDERFFCINERHHNMGSKFTSCRPIFCAYSPSEISPHPSQQIAMPFIVELQARP